MATIAPSAAPRHRRLGLAGAALLLPALASAQGAPLAPRGLALIPYVGWATGTTRAETWSYLDGSGAAVREEVKMHLADGLAAGLNVQLPVVGSLSLLGGALYVDRDAADFSINGGESWTFTGSRSVFIKAGAALQLPQSDDPLVVHRLGAALFLAPFYMFEKPQPIASIPDSDLFDSAHHIGLSFGASGELPFARDRLTLQVGLEDYLTFWDEAGLQRLPDWLHDAPPGNATGVQADPTHQWLLRAGFSLRLR